MHRLEPGTRAEHDTFARCRRCDQLYWPGSHTPALERIVADAAGNIYASTDAYASVLRIASGSRERGGSIMRKASTWSRWLARSTR